MKYNSIIYFISLVILATLCTQAYWNYTNYQTSKQQLINDVQTSLDNAVDTYYAQLATHRSSNLANDSIRIAFISDLSSTPSGDQMNVIIKDSINSFSFSTTGATQPNQVVTLQQSTSVDSAGTSFSTRDSLELDVAGDSLRRYFDRLRKPVDELSSKIIISIVEDQFSLEKIDSLFSVELDRKSIPVAYGLSHTGLLQQKEVIRPNIIETANLETISKSPYFFHENDLKAHFGNITLVVLKRNLLGILLSLLLVGSVIICLLYLLKIIKQQKQLAELKNDLISNITHEFKTPIATIGVAMEAIQSFNAKNDTEKNLRYAKISGEQVEKLNIMVEKLLETASLDSEKLELNLELFNLVELLQKASQHETLSVAEKQISFTASEESILYKIDPFHFENAINNIIDNAIKYGGAHISADIQKNKNAVIITIKDSGNSLTEAQKKQLFEKFYRVPKGNTHDIKGFGIGLYYTKKIIEKHGGSIELSIQPTTTFTIVLPNG